MPSPPIVPASNPEIRPDLSYALDAEPANSAMLSSIAIPVADSTEGFRLLHKQPTQRQSTSCIGGVTTTIVIAVPWSCMVVNVFGRWQVLTWDTGVIDATNYAILAPDTRYWVYVYSLGGNPTLAITTTPPNPSFTYQAGGFTHAFLTTFMTTGMGHIWGYRQAGHTFRYSNYATGGYPLLLTAGTQILPTAVSLSPAIPNGATEASLSAKFVNTVANEMGIISGANPGVVFPLRDIMFGPSQGAAFEQAAECTISPTSAHTVTYYVTANTANMSIFAKGFTL